MTLGAPIWIDLATSDVDRAKDFYAALFGWTYRTGGAEYGSYVNAFKDGRIVAGMMHNDPQWGMPDSWTVYLHTADINVSLAAVPDAGGTNCEGAMQIPGKGTMAMVLDPSGAPFGLWQPGGHDGFEAMGEAGSPGWFQVTVRDYDKSLAFYRQAFGWTTRVESDTDEFRYSTAMFEGEPRAGVMDGSKILPEGMPSHWTVFLAADDVDKTLQVVTEHGGNVLRAAEDTPYGRLASVTDPTGTVFNLCSVEG